MGFRLIPLSWINYESENSLAFKMRKHRSQWIKELIISCFNIFGEVRIIDVGGTKEYWNIISEEFLLNQNVHITIVNLPASTNHTKDDNIFTFRPGDGTNLKEYKDKSFHIAHSNSVIEHLGNYKNEEAFSNEIKRVGRWYYIQTPNYWFPMEPHYLIPFFNWLPIKVRILLIQNFNLGWFKKTKDIEKARKIIQSIKLLRKKELVRLFPDSIVNKERIVFITKSFVLTNKNENL